MFFCLNNFHLLTSILGLKATDMNVSYVYEFEDQRLELELNYLNSGRDRARFEIWDMNVNEKSNVFLNFYSNSIQSDEYQRNKSYLDKRSQKLFFVWLDKLFSTFVTDKLAELNYTLYGKTSEKICCNYTMEYHVYKLYIHDCIGVIRNNILNQFIKYNEIRKINRNKYENNSLVFKDITDSEIEEIFNCSIKELKHKLRKENALVKYIIPFIVNQYNSNFTDIELNEIGTGIKSNLNNYFTEKNIVDKISKSICDSNYSINWYRFAKNRYNKWLAIVDSALNGFESRNKTTKINIGLCEYNQYIDFESDFDILLNSTNYIPEPSKDKILCLKKMNNEILGYLQNLENSYNIEIKNINKYEDFNGSSKGEIFDTNGDIVQYEKNIHLEEMFKTIFSISDALKIDFDFNWFQNLLFANFEVTFPHMKICRIIY